MQCERVKSMKSKVNYCFQFQSEKVQSLTDALEACFTKESLQGFTCSKTNTEVK